MKKQIKSKFIDIDLNPKISWFVQSINDLTSFYNKFLSGFELATHLLPN